MKKPNYFTFYFFLVLLILLLVELPRQWQITNFENLKYLILSLFSLISICYFSFQLFIKKEVFKLSLTDIFFLLFVTWSFLSYTWALNKSYSFFYSFAWLNGYLLYKNFTLLFRKKINVLIIQNVLSIIFCVSFLMTLAYAFNNGNIRLSDKYLLDNLKINANGLITTLLCLFPFLLNSIEKNIKGIFALILSSIFFYFVIKNDVQAAKFALIFISIFYLIKKSKKVKFKHYLFILLLLGSANILLFLLNTKFNWWPEIANISNVFGLEDRFLMWSKSFAYIENNYLKGVGNGNWFFYFTQQSGKVNFSNFTHPHNLYIQIIVELGLIGFALIIAAFFNPVIKLFKHSAHSAFSLAAAAYLIVAFFYGITNFNYNHCGSAVIIFLISIAVAKVDNKLTNKIYIPFLLISLAIANLMWFSNNFNIENKLLKVRVKKITKAKERVALIKDLYNPTIKTHFKNIPLPYYAIKHIENMKPVSKKYALQLDTFYQQLNILEPNNTRYQHLYAKHLFNLGDQFNSKKILQKLISQDENYLFSRLLLAKIEFSFGNYTYADALLNFDEFVFEKVYKIENKYFINHSKKAYLSDKKFIELKDELVQLKKKIKRKLRQQKLKK